MGRPAAAAGRGADMPATLVGFGAVALAVALATGLAACSGNATPAPASTSATAPSAAPSATPAPTSPVTGVVTAVDSAGLDKVSGFTLRLADGTEVPFRIGMLENGAEFPPGHLTEHVVSAAPVRVFFRAESGALVVYRIEDAG